MNILSVVFLLSFLSQICFGQSAPYLREFQKIPCPTQRAIDLYVEEFNIADSFSNFSCDDQDPRTFLLKSLSVLHKMNFAPPEKWGTEAQEIFKDLKSYLKKHIKKMKFSTDTSTSTVVSSNPGSGEMQLTARIKELSVIEFISMLVHEVRHLHAPHRGHSMCTAGDMPGTESACDELLTTEFSKLASYNFEVMFLSGLSMYNKNIDSSQKAFAGQKALALIASRFNNFKNNTAFYHDVLFALDSHNKVQIWHPYVRNWVTLDIQISNDTIEKIESANEAFSISIFTKKGRFYVWNLFKGLRLHPSSRSDNEFIQGAQQVVLSDFQNDTFMTVISNGRIKAMMYDQNTNQRILRELPLYELDDFKKSRFTDIFYGIFNEVLVLTENGNLLRLRRSAQSPHLMKIAELDEHGPWISGTGGLLYEDMLLVNKNGELYRFSVKNKQDISSLTESEFESESYLSKKVILPFDLKIKKYRQGSFGDYVLDTFGQVHFYSREKKSLKTFESQKLKDFTVLKTIVPMGALSQITNQSNREFVKNCQIVDTMWDPILYRGMGLTQNGELIFSDLSGGCLRAPQIKDVSASVIGFINSSQFDERILVNIKSNGANFRSNPQLVLKNKRGEIGLKYSPEP